MPDVTLAGFNRFAVDFIILKKKKMGTNLQWLPHVPGIFQNLTNFPQNFSKQKQFDHNLASLLSFNPIQNIPPSSCPTNLESSPITQELDSPCSILTSYYPNTPSPSSYLINQSSTNSTTSNSSEIVNDADYHVLNNSISTHYGSTSSHKIYDDNWNGGEMCTQQEMNLDQNPSEFTELMNLPNLMINTGHGMSHSSEFLSYPLWFQPSQFDQQQRMGLMLDSNFPYYGSPIIGSGFAENALIMDMKIQEGLFDIPNQIYQINKLTDQDNAKREFERKQDRKLKNRESAARSRVRKQARVNYLESKRLKLKKENDLLNKELEFLRPIPRARIQLRRTSSYETSEYKFHF